MKDLNKQLNEAVLVGARYSNLKNKALACIQSLNEVNHASFKDTLSVDDFKVIEAAYNLMRRIEDTYQPHEALEYIKKLNS